jgi:large subunit ribosomal protein L49
VEVVKNPPEWKYVEDLLGYQTIPKPSPKAEYPSGWCPPDIKRSQNLQYSVERTKNHMLPVYLYVGFRGQNRLSKVRFIEGDIWQMEQDLRNLIQSKTGKPCESRINEMNRSITFKGDYVTLIQKYFYSLGL